MTITHTFVNHSFQRMANLVNETSSGEDTTWIAYGSVMSLILSVGFIGNTLAIVVFLQKSHRIKVISPFIINLAVADLFIVIFGYPVAIEANLSGQRLQNESTRCVWSGFINGSVGITSIVMLAEISMIMCYSITTVKPPKQRRFSSKRKVFMVLGAWVYGVLCMLPPLLGWSRFVPGAAGISCGPEWWAIDTATLAYHALLLVFGFIVPMAVIFYCYYKIYRSLALNSMLSSQSTLLARRRKSQFKVARMVAICIAAFVVSWSPYCVVCLAAMITKKNVLQSGEAEIPELMAKASVIYNPIVYAAMNRGVRDTLKSVMMCKEQRLKRQSSATQQSSRETQFQDQTFLDRQNHFSEEDEL